MSRSRTSRRRSSPLAAAAPTAHCPRKCRAAPSATKSTPLHHQVSRRSHDACHATAPGASSLHQPPAAGNVPGHRRRIAPPACRAATKPHAAPQAASVHAKCRMMHQMQFCSLAGRSPERGADGGPEPARHPLSGTVATPPDRSPRSSSAVSEQPASRTRSGSRSWDEPQAGTCRPPRPPRQEAASGRSDRPCHERSPRPHASRNRRARDRRHRRRATPTGQASAERPDPACRCSWTGRSCQAGPEPARRPAGSARPCPSNPAPAGHVQRGGV